jgi:hypothetical protein
MSNTLQIKKHLKKRVHCSNNKTKLSQPLQCSWCYNDDKRRKGTFDSCRTFYFHLKYCYARITYPVNPTINEAIEELQRLSDSVIQENKV